MLTARKFAQEMGVDYTTVVRWLKNELVPDAVRQESEDRGVWWEIPETSLKMERPKPGPAPKAKQPAPAEKPTKKGGRVEAKKASKKAKKGSDR